MGGVIRFPGTTRAKMRNHWFVLLIVLIAACGGGDVFEGVTPTTSVRVAGVVEPGGGTIESDDGWTLEGIALEVPAGAVSESTAIQLAVQTVNEPLPAGYIPVGSSLGTTPEDLVLDAEARVTVPYFAELRAANDDERLAVALFAQDEWTILEADEVRADRVTAGTAALGVLQVVEDRRGSADALECVTNGTCSLHTAGFLPVTETDCAGEACVRRLHRFENIVAMGPLHIDEGSVVILAANGPFGSSFVTSRLVDLSNGGESIGAAIEVQNAFDALRWRGGVTDGGGIWVAHRDGAVRASYENVSSFSFFSNQPLATYVLETAEGETILVSVREDRFDVHVRRGGAWSAPIPVDGSVVVPGSGRALSEAVVVIDDVRDRSSFRIAAGAAATELIEVDFEAELASPQVVGEPVELPCTAGEVRASAASGTDAHALACVGQPGVFIWNGSEYVAVGSDSGLVADLVASDSGYAALLADAHAVGVFAADSVEIWALPDEVGAISALAVDGDGIVLRGADGWVSVLE